MPSQPIWSVSRGGDTKPVWTYHHLSRQLASGYSIVGGSRYATREADAVIGGTIVAVEGVKPHQNPPNYSSKGSAV